MGSENILKLILSIIPSTPSIFPIMSLFKTPIISQFCSFAYLANPAPPYNPCSSPDKPTYIILFSNLYLLKTLAASITPAMPDALSFAPGDKDMKSLESLTRLSISPLIIINLFGLVLPL